MNRLEVSETHLRNLFRDGMWFRIPWPFLSALSGDQAVTLAYLLNLPVDAEGWSHVSRKYMEARLFFSADRQARVLTRLREGGYIDVRTEKGENNPRRLVRVSVERIWDAFGSIYSDQTALPDHKTTTRKYNVVLQRKRDNAEETTLKRAPGTLFTTFEDKCAAHLHETVLRHLNINKPIRGWAATFGYLQSYEHVPPHRVKRALIWYRKHCGESMFVPHIEDASSFRAKFGALEQAIKRQEAEHPAPVEVTPQAKRIVERLSTLTWPQGSRSQLPQVVQKSLEAYKEWKRKCLAAQPVPDKLRGFEEELLNMVFWHSSEFLEGWFRSVHKRVANWADWSGDLTHYTFAEDHVDFLKLGRAASERYSGSTKMWDRYLKFIHEGGTH